MDGNGGWPGEAEGGVAFVVALNNLQSSIGSIAELKAWLNSDFRKQFSQATLRVVTKCVNGETDYKTLRVCATTTCVEIIGKLLTKLRLTTDNADNYALWMKVRTRRTGGEERVSFVELDSGSAPLVQQCYRSGLLTFDLTSPRLQPVTKRVGRYATCDRDLRMRIHKIPGVPIMYIRNHRYTIERLPDAYGLAKLG